jgi:hypothetical protein
LVPCRETRIAVSKNDILQLRRLALSRESGASIDIGMVEFCTCVSGDALAYLKLIQLSRLA